MTYTFSRISTERDRYHQRLLNTILSVDTDGVVSIADRSNNYSKDVSLALVRQLGDPRVGKKESGQSMGSLFEEATLEFIDRTFVGLLQTLRPGRWSVSKAGKGMSGIHHYEQYKHLQEISELLALAKRNRSGAFSALASEYIISPDIIVSRMPEPDDLINSNALVVDDKIALYSPIRMVNNSIPLLHASVSCKWTFRSDRAQNARSEALNLIRNRKGRAPHICVVTAEPTPSRLASLALGTGDLDCVYHLALYELQNAVNSFPNEEGKEMLATLIDGKRLKDISDLPLDLTI